MKDSKKELSSSSLEKNLFRFLMVRYLEFIKAICKQSNMWELYNPRVIGMVHNIIKCVQE